MAPGHPATPGIIACPGGAAFVDEMVPHLRRFYVRKFHHLADQIAERYSIPKEEAIRRMNLSADIRRLWSDRHAPADTYRLAPFKIPVKFTRFANGEFKSEILQSVRGQDVYIVQDVENHYPLAFDNAPERYSLSVNDNVMCVFVTVDAALQAGANSVTLVLPAYPFARQHKKKGREALSASMFGRLLEHAGVSRVITLDIHSKEIENSFGRMRLENLHASYQIMRKLTELIDVRETDLVVVSPDTGAVDRNKFYAGALGKPLALLYKERDYSKVTRDAKRNNITAIRLLGSVEGKTVFMADDLIGTGGTLIKAMEYLKEMGAQRIICAISLPLFTGGAIADFEEAYRAGLFDKIVGTNAVYHTEELLSREWFASVNIAPLFARIIARLHHGRSLSPLLDNRKIIQRLLNQ